jgi:hypothetical protein
LSTSGGERVDKVDLRPFVNGIEELGHDHKLARKRCELGSGRHRRVDGLGESVSKCFESRRPVATLRSFQNITQSDRQSELSTFPCGQLLKKPQRGKTDDKGQDHANFKI